jgi:hypothetical protein
LADVVLTVNDGSSLYKGMMLSIMIVVMGDGTGTVSHAARLEHQIDPLINGGGRQLLSGCQEQAGQRQKANQTIFSSASQREGTVF